MMLTDKAGSLAMLEKLGYSVNKQGGHGTWVEEQPSFSTRICSLFPFTSEASTRTPKHSTQIFTLLRFLGLGSLLLSVRGQRTDPFPAQFELSSLDGRNGFVLEGEKGLEKSGNFVSSAGDFNGDGIDDILIGDFLAQPPLRGAQAGKTYVVFGSRDIGSIGYLKLSNLNSTNSIVLNGDQWRDWSGFSVSSAGDINVDGIADILIGAPGLIGPSGNSRGKTYVVFGGSNVGRNGTLELSSLNGTNGFVINGEQDGDQSGFSISNAGDVNGDGTIDLLIGAWFADPLGKRMAGKTYVIFGGNELATGGVLDLSSLNGTIGFVLNGENGDDQSGRSVSNAGDVDSDGTPDLIIGAYLASPSSISWDAGKSYVIYGGLGLGSNGTVELSSLNGANGFVLNGERFDDNSGISVSGAGDVNGDGTDDILIGAYTADPASSRTNAGKSYVIFGGPSRGSGGVFELSSLNGPNGFVLNGEYSGDLCGRSVSSAGDINGDGIKDLLIGARSADPSLDQHNAGKTYVVFGGRSIGRNGTIELSRLNGTTGFVLIGEEAGEYSGASVSNAGDVNGDGIDDLLVGAPGNETGLPPLKAYVIFGRNVTQTLSPSKLPSTSNPTSVSQPLPPQTLLTSRNPFASSKSANPLNPVTPTLAKAPTTASTDPTPLYIGIAVAVTAFACSLFAGGQFYSRKSRSRPASAEQEFQLDATDPSSPYVAIDSLLSEMVSARDANYDKIQIPSTSNQNPNGPYADVRKKIEEEEAKDPKAHYTTIDKIEKAHDLEEEAKLQKIQNGDDPAS